MTVGHRWSSTFFQILESQRIHSHWHPLKANVLLHASLVDGGEFSMGNFLRPIGEALEAFFRFLSDNLNFVAVLPRGSFTTYAESFIEENLTFFILALTLFAASISYLLVRNRRYITKIQKETPWYSEIKIGLCPRCGRIDALFFYRQNVRSLAKEDPKLPDDWDDISIWEKAISCNTCGEFAA